jgi:hypoxanthine phosphoribosyltransferase
MKFAHYSEKLFSEHLDLFDIIWIYEPRSFPLRWGSGAIKMMFTPDFYLPEYDTYIEITTMDQKLITKKQKKIKLARKLYPQTTFKLINEKEFYNFLTKDEEQSVKEAIAS